MCRPQGRRYVQVRAPRDETTWQPGTFSDNSYILSSVGVSPEGLAPQARTFGLVCQLSVRPTMTGCAELNGSSCISSEAGRVHSMIEVENLSKRYGPTLAVSGVSFSVQKGEVLGFLGPNGAGKTTTMRVITGFFPPTEGKVRVAGYDVVEEPLEAKRRTGYLPETPPIYPDMTVTEYLAFVGRIKGIPRRELKPRLDEISERCAITDVRHRQLG